MQRLFGSWRLPLPALALLVGVGCGGSDATPIGAGASEVNAAGGKVGTVDSVTLPIVEVSGLGQRKKGSKAEFLAVGDASTTLATFAISNAGKVANVETHDLSDLFDGKVSQWEAVAGDGEGRVFLLEEGRDTIHVVASDLKKVTNRITLTIPKNHELHDDWKDPANENSRGEGMVLLSNGHVLVAKEKSPAALVEFAPKGAEAEGFRAELALGSKAFKLPPGDELVATKHWLLKAADESTLGDISDLALDSENRLLLLSDQGRAIARIERTLDVTEGKIDIKAIFKLPAEVDKPEGLAFAAGSPFVAIDGKNESKDCVFRVEALP
jgi:hypothetical protein